MYHSFLPIQQPCRKVNLVLFIMSRNDINTTKVFQLHKVIDILNIKQLINMIIQSAEAGKLRRDY